MSDRAPGAAVVRVLLEVGTKRTFACALDWPGLARSGRDEETALDALRATLPRYAALLAGGPDAPPAPDATFEVVERVEGDATTDFGAPGTVGEADRAPVDADGARRLARLVELVWAAFDTAAARAPEELRLGPRGGGRNRTKLVGHVEEAEQAYGATIGVPPGDRKETGVRRAAIAALLGAPSDGSPLAGKRWPPRYAARRIAWHVLDHLWEMEDRSE